jgi:hypothetical protein
LHGTDDPGFAGGTDPAAVFVEVGEGADGAEHFGAGKVALVDFLDNVSEGGLKIAVAQSEKIEGVGVALDGGFGQDAKTAHDGVRAAPVKEGFGDGLALRMAPGIESGAQGAAGLGGGGVVGIGAGSGWFSRSCSAAWRSSA